MVCQMQVETQVALNFILSYLYNKLPRTRVHLYGEELEVAIHKKFESHWYPTTPNKGSAYRCIHFNASEIDPAFETAAVRSGLDFHNDIKPHLPSPLSVWVDPGEVSYKISSPDGKGGTVKILYRGSVLPNNQFLPIQDNRVDVMPNPHPNPPLQFGFNPNAKDFLPKSPSSNNMFVPHQGQAEFGTTQECAMGFNSRPQKRLYTVDEFASTKFGSTKMKTIGVFSEATPAMRNPSKYNNYNQSGMMGNAPNNRPQSLGFNSNWDSNNTFVSTPEFPEYDFAQSRSTAQFQRKTSSFDSSSSTSSSIDNLNSPIKLSSTDAPMMSQWSPGNEQADVLDVVKPYYNQSGDKWSSDTDSFFNDFKPFNDGGISCQ